MTLPAPVHFVVAFSPSPRDCRLVGDSDHRPGDHFHAAGYPEVEKYPSVSYHSTDIRRAGPS